MVTVTVCDFACPIVGGTSETLIECTPGPKSGAVETKCDVVVKWESDGTAVEGGVDKLTYTNAGGGSINREREAGKESSQTDNIASNGIKIYLNVDTAINMDNSDKTDINRDISGETGYKKYNRRDTSNEADNNVDTKNTDDEWLLRWIL